MGAIQKPEAIIKRCPFCGGLAAIQEIAPGAWKVFCRTCSASTGKYATKSESLKWWNLRTPSAPERKD